MADIPNREALEAELAKLIGKYNRKELSALMEILILSPSIASVPPEFWKQSAQSLVSILMPFSEAVFMASAENMLTGFPVGVDWALINQSAADWARSYSTLLAGQINSTSRSAVAKGINNAVAAFFEEGLTIDEMVARMEADPELAKLFTKDVRDRLGRVFGPHRAEMIAQTEVTRAQMQGEVATADELRRQGVDMVAVWYTSNDEIVCPICGPRHEKKQGDGWFVAEPAHPRCRCRIEHEFVKEPARG